MSFLGWLGQPAVLPWVALTIGLCVGSFLNVVIHRLPRMMEREWRAQCAELVATTASVPAAPEAPYNLWVPRSACPSCGHRIGALENVPLLSWLWLRARCSACGAAISLRYPVIELAGGVVAAYAASRYGLTLAALGAVIFCCGLLALAAIDLDTQLLPDDITLPLLWIGLAFNVGATFAPVGSAVIGAMAGYLSLWLVYWAFKLITGKEGMGYGDFKLLAAIGAWLGWQMLPLVILLSSVVGATVGIALIVFTRHGRDKPIPFGPYLAAAGAIALLWGDDIARRWLPLLA
ncbi:MAG: prepilin peptidase [Betaproteobacteria bacterium]|nr:MAG: prepilin peptidase [Betaproteobacteria bacterium]